MEIYLKIENRASVPAANHQKDTLDVCLSASESLFFQSASYSR